MKKILSLLALLTLGVSVNMPTFQCGEHDHEEIGIHANEHESHNHQIKKASTATTEINIGRVTMVDYFSNLKTNFGNNQGGSCGYVALGSYLTYYDTVLNDNIVPEQFDVVTSGTSASAVKANSPGSRFEVLDYLKANPSIYTNEINRTADTVLHSALVQHGSTHGIGLGNGPSNYADIIDGVIGANINFTVNRATYSNAAHRANPLQEYNRMFNIARQSIDQGVPVLLSISRARVNATTGLEELVDHHAVVAYDYDLNLNQLLAHFGWGRSTAYVSLASQDYTVIRTVNSISFNVSHVHSNNYVINGYAYCGCGQHNHRLAYSSFTEAYHVVRCIDCGVYYTEAHNMPITAGFTAGHFDFCQCGYNEPLLPHIFEYDAKDATSHYASCVVCGYYHIEAHTFNTIGIRRRCTKCAYVSSPILIPKL